MTALLILQFFIPLALNSYEYHFKPDEPRCSREWSAPYHEIMTMPWIIHAVRILFRWC